VKTLNGLPDLVSIAPGSVSRVAAEMPTRMPDIAKLVAIASSRTTAKGS
jgi:hypothetical protein